MFKNDLCCAHDIIEAKNTAKVARTVIMLVNYNQFIHQQQQLQQINNDQQNIDFRQLTTIGNAMISNNTTNNNHLNTHHHHHNQQQQQNQQKQQQQQQTAV